jgi:hypothetical protein
MQNFSHIKFPLQKILIMTENPVLGTHVNQGHFERSRSKLASPRKFRKGHLKHGPVIAEKFKIREDPS